MTRIREEEELLAEMIVHVWFLIHQS